ncbi:hypothetical protein O3P69_014043 [Scylla paramamosain]|uniref:Uncharacterized protein n=1 Tax=Scylla paramamosain TaxID=85552 RepID=A0AAW0SS39_SCYPA
MVRALKGLAGGIRRECQVRPAHVDNLPPSLPLPARGRCAVDIKRPHSTGHTSSPTLPYTSDMKLVLLACLAAVAVAAPQFIDRPVVLVLRDDRQDNGDGNFNFAFEADNGIVEERSGTPGVVGQANMQGSFRFPLPDGSFAEVRYVADEGGFRPESPLLPTPHPLPAHAIEQIRIAEEQRARGITFE